MRAFDQRIEQLRVLGLVTKTGNPKPTPMSPAQVDMMRWEDMMADVRYYRMEILGKKLAQKIVDGCKMSIRISLYEARIYRIDAKKKS